MAGMRRGMCTAPAARTRRCRTATTWIIMSPATFTTRTATTATITVHWFLPREVTLCLRGSRLRLAHWRGRGCLDEAKGSGRQSPVHIPGAGQAIPASTAHRLPLHVQESHGSADVPVSNRLAQALAHGLRLYPSARATPTVRELQDLLAGYYRHGALPPLRFCAVGITDSGCEKPTKEVYEIIELRRYRRQM